MNNVLAENKVYWDRFDYNDALHAMNPSWEAFNNDMDEFFKELNKLKKPKRLLDWGCGIGRLYYKFKFRNYQYVGIDISRNMIKNFRRYTKDDGIVFMIDGINTPFDDKYFDIIWCWSVFTHVNIATAIEILFEMKRILKDDGTIYLSYISSDRTEKEEGKITLMKYNETYFESLLKIHTLNIISKKKVAEGKEGKYQLLLELKK